MLENQYLNGYNGPIMTDDQMGLIKTTVNRRIGKVESRPYKLSEVLRYTPVCLASMTEAQEVSQQILQQRKKLLDDFKSEYEEEIKRLEGEDLEVFRTDYSPFLENYEEIGRLLMLGWFEPDTGWVKICLEAIENLCLKQGLDYNTIVCAVTIHELAHALMHNPLHQAYTDISELWLEESLANKIMLEYMPFWNVEKFVDSQPPEYKAGRILFDLNSSDWYVLRSNKTCIDHAKARRWMKYLMQAMNKENCDKRELDSLFYRIFSNCKTSSRNASDNSPFEPPIIDRIKMKADAIKTPARFDPDGIVVEKKYIDTSSSGEIYVFINNGKSGFYNVTRWYNHYDHLYKVICPKRISIKTEGKRHKVNLGPIILGPGQLCSDSFCVVGIYKEYEEAYKCTQLLCSKFVKYMALTYGLNPEIVEGLMHIRYPYYYKFDNHTTIYNIDNEIYQHLGLTQDEVEDIEVRIM